MTSLYDSLVQLRDDLAAGKRPHVDIPQSALEKLQSISEFPLLPGLGPVTPREDATSQPVSHVKPVTGDGSAQASSQSSNTQVDTQAATTGHADSVSAQGSDAAMSAPQPHRYGVSETMSSTVSSSLGRSVTPSGHKSQQEHLVPMDAACLAPVASLASAATTIRAADESAREMASIKQSRDKIESEIQEKNRKNRDSLFCDDSYLPNLAEIHDKAVEAIQPIPYVDPATLPKALPSISAVQSKPAKTRSHASFDTNDYYSSQDNDLSSDVDETLAAKQDHVASGPHDAPYAASVKSIKKPQRTSQPGHSSNVIVLSDSENTNGESDYFPPDATEDDTPNMTLHGSKKNRALKAESGGEDLDEEYVPQLDNDRQLAPPNDTSRPSTRSSAKIGHESLAQASNTHGATRKSIASGKPDGTAQSTDSSSQPAGSSVLGSDETRHSSDETSTGVVHFDRIAKHLTKKQRMAVLKAMEKVNVREKSSKRERRSKAKKAKKPLSKHKKKQNKIMAAPYDGPPTTRSMAIKKRVADDATDAVEEPQGKRPRFSAVQAQTDEPVVIKSEQTSPPPLSDAIARARELARLQTSSSRNSTSFVRPEGDLRRVASLNAMQPQSRAPYPAGQSVAGSPQIHTRPSSPHMPQPGYDPMRPSSPYVTNGSPNGMLYARPRRKAVRDQFGNIYVAAGPADPSLDPNVMYFRYSPPPPGFSPQHHEQSSGDAAQMPPPPPGHAAYGQHNSPLASHAPTPYPRPAPTEHSAAPSSQPLTRAGSVYRVPQSPAAYPSPRPGVTYFEQPQGQAYMQQYEPQQQFPLARQQSGFLTPTPQMAPSRQVSVVRADVDFAASAQPQYLQQQQSHQPGPGAVYANQYGYQPWSKGHSTS